MAYTKEQREAKKANIEEERKLSIDNIPLTANIWVHSNCYGQLIYISKKTGFRIDWDNFGAKQPMSLEELMILRNTQKVFFEKNWIAVKNFVDSKYSNNFSVEEILDFLQVKNYYKDSFFSENLDDIFNLPANEIAVRVAELPQGVKDSILVRANELITNGIMYDLRTINALEKSLKCELSRPE